MAEKVSLQQLYSSHFAPDAIEKFMLSPQLGHFNVFPRGELCRQLTPFIRRDYYKISLVEGYGRLHYTNRTIEINGRALVFYNPAVPYTWEPLSDEQAGYFCMFNNHFIAPSLSDNNVTYSALFNTALNPVYQLTDEQEESLRFIFRKMMHEVESSYTEKYELLRHYFLLVIHEANKMEPAVAANEKYVNAPVRISSLFIEMLERQFPVDSTEHALKLKTPNDFASRLAVHVNHLNRSVKEITGKSTSEIIALRIAREAHLLLRHTDSTVAEIAYSLGFEHPSNFNSFFKKHSGQTPRTVRNTLGQAV